MAERPLSPHLQVYRPQLTSVLSISHRMSGVALAAGSILLVWWLAAAASGPEAYDCIQQKLATLPGKLVLMGWSAAFFYHLSNGVRHLFWDMGVGFDMDSVYTSGYAVMASATLLTLFTWGLIWLGGAA